MEKPSKQEYAVAKHLRFNVPVKEGKLVGMTVQYFIGKHSPSQKGVCAACHLFSDNLKNHLLRTLNNFFVNKLLKCLFQTYT